MHARVQAAPEYLMVVELYLRWLHEPSLCMVGRGPVIRALSLFWVW